MNTKKSAYKKAGVDIDLADQFTTIIGQSIKSLPKNNIYKSIGGYAGLYKLSKDMYIASTTDGVGTKLKVAFLLNQHNTIGIDLVAMSVNDLICVGATPLFFLDYFATSKLNIKQATKVIAGIINGCKQSNVALIGGETAEMPDIYNHGEYDLAGFAVGIVNKKDLLDGSRVRHGDILIGFESSGPHSNGYSLIRRLFKSNEKKWMREILKPTKIYVSLFSQLQKALRNNLKGMAHITGSGFLNIPRINPKFQYVIKIPKTYKRKKIFDEIIKRSKMDLEQAYQTINMGFGLVVAVNPNSISKIMKIAKNNKLKATEIGRISNANKKNQSSVLIYDQGIVIRLQ